jgi:hypothetical protein
VLDKSGGVLFENVYNGRTRFFRSSSILLMMALNKPESKKRERKLLLLEALKVGVDSMCLVDLE